MPRNVIKVNLEIDRIHCHDEGDGWGNAEPYLWTVFFKIDGDTVQLTEALKLSGPPVTHNTPGSHGNLGNTDVDEGDDVMVPAAIGEWETLLRPIPTPAVLSTLLEDIGGVIGVVVILMEEDNVSDSGAEAGHQALNVAVRNALQTVINTRTLTSQDVSEEEIKGFTSTIESKIKDAVVNQQNIFENLWSWLNPDDTIGTKVFIFKHDDLDPEATIGFSYRWRNEGDWEIFGHIGATPLCPVGALEGVFARGAAGPVGRAPAGDLADMRAFRDGMYRKMPGLAHWFALAERHATRVVRLVLTQPDLRLSASKVLEWGAMIARDRDVTLSVEHTAHAERLLTALSQHRNHSAQVDARRALSMLAQLEGMTNLQALEMLAATPPARHPTVHGTASNRGTRIPRRTPKP